MNGIGSIAIQTIAGGLVGAGAGLIARAERDEQATHHGAKIAAGFGSMGLGYVGIFSQIGAMDGATSLINAGGYAGMMGGLVAGGIGAYLLSGD